MYYISMKCNCKKYCLFYYISSVYVSGFSGSFPDRNWLNSWIIIIPSVQFVIIASKQNRIWYCFSSFHEHCATSDTLYLFSWTLCVNFILALYMQCIVLFPLDGAVEITPAGLPQEEITQYIAAKLLWTKIKAILNLI